MLLLGAMLTEPGAFAHRIDEYLQATLLTIGSDRVQASMRLIPGVLTAPQVIASIDTDQDGVFSDAEEKSYALRVLADLAIEVDGKDARLELGSWSLPQPAQLRDGLGEIHIEYSVVLPQGGSKRSFSLENRHLRARSVYLVNVVSPEGGSTLILTQRRNEAQSVYEVEFQQSQAAPRGLMESLAVWLRGLELRSLFHLGMRHIAEGTDHLLFLLVLLLPAPLLAAGGRWVGSAGVRRSVMHILGIVTAFTLGHSITLTLAALGFVAMPTRLVEVLIAVSILVSAVHALRPIFPGREAFIAGFFGLIHGLAFAATLDRLGLDWRDRVAGILAFNLGIEAMQMLVVLAVLPSLMLMSRTRAYPALRIGGGLLAGAASLGWIAERLLDIRTPVDAAMNLIARHAAQFALLLFAVSLACRWRFLAGGETIGERDSRGGLHDPVRSREEVA